MDFKSAFTKNWPYKLAAIVLSVLLWLSVSAEAEIAAGDWRGPLHGVPYAPKDILATAGILTTNGSKATADWVPDDESTITARLNDAGAILIGKLNLLEFAMGSGVLSGFGPARNPWATDYTPSGSSSGSGPALAANFPRSGSRRLHDFALVLLNRNEFVYRP